MNTDIEREVVTTVDDLINKGDYGNICFEIGKFIDQVASEIYGEKNNTAPRNAKAAVDYLIEKKIVDRVLGHKLHVVRELRNVEAHDLPYDVSLADARFSAETLNQFIYWLHQGDLIRRWHDITVRFDEGVRLFKESKYEDDLEEPVSLLYRCMGDAVDIKLRSLGIDRSMNYISSSVKFLLTKGIDVRSRAWELLVGERLKEAHGRSGKMLENDFALLKALLPELRSTFEKFNPLSEQTSGRSEIPQVATAGRFSDSS